jgi:type II secretory pathway pseudopilin PulG
MSVMRACSPAPARIKGFSLVELMVALVVGMVVIGAVLALILSIIRSNNQTIAATRLTQELRATASVIAADLRRAGGVNDPLTIATAAGGNPFKTIELLDATATGCIRYGYANPAGGNFHAVSLSGGAVFIDVDDVAANATCGGGQRLNSAAVSIDNMTFTINGRRIDITLSGALQDDAAIRRTLTQTVFVRSVGGS